MDKKCLIVVDSNSVAHRAFHALPPLSNKKGEPLGAVYGFLLVFLKALKEFQPDFIAATFDLPGITFRHKEFQPYKANRPKMPDELFSQISKIKDVLRAFNVIIFEKQGFEADDIIATIAKLAAEEQAMPGLETIILSGDADVFQLIDKSTKVYSLKKGVKNTVLYDIEKIKEKYGGLTPEQLPDFKGLRGDPSDNIPGVRGIGEKNGIKLIKEFGSISNLYKELDINTEKTKLISSRIKEILSSRKEDAFLSKKLIQARRDVPIEFSINDCRFGGYEKEKIIKIFQEMEFYSLINRATDLFNALKKDRIC
jgi:DNA polymerase I